ncbi:glutathione transferase GstA [Rickettsiella massiliensis]|uniref:glutathione transferase GstA n=1 Tax=Rickettsiella massiliensis TaxID=676517 RepID=UPI00029A7870|nr:glutathione transferase GstA [Rickettsiella massiliensis]
MKLFYAPGACSLSPHIVLREIGLDFTLEKIDLVKKKTELGTDYLKINPKGQVPALLLDNGSLLTEGVAIVQYLADQLPSSGLFPPIGSLLRYHTIEWLNYISTELHKGFSPLFKSNTPEDYKVIVRDNLGKNFIYLDGVLKGKQYLQGDNFCIADAHLFAILRLAIVLKFDLEKYKNISDYFNRVLERQSVKDALSEEGIN